MLAGRATMVRVKPMFVLLQALGWALFLAIVAGAAEWSW